VSHRYRHDNNDAMTNFLRDDAGLLWNRSTNYKRRSISMNSAHSGSRPVSIRSSTGLRIRADSLIEMWLAAADPDCLEAIRGTARRGWLVDRAETGVPDAAC
jgi:hypothetical protein